MLLGNQHWPATLKHRAELEPLWTKGQGKSMVDNDLLFLPFASIAVWVTVSVSIFVALSQFFIVRGFLFERNLN